MRVNRSPARCSLGPFSFCRFGPWVPARFDSLSSLNVTYDAVIVRGKQIENAKEKLGLKLSENITLQSCFSVEEVERAIRGNRSVWVHCRKYVNDYYLE